LKGGIHLAAFAIKGCDNSMKTEARIRSRATTNTGSDIDLVNYHQEDAMPMKNPPHPGDLIRTEVVEALGLNVSQAAQVLNVRPATLSDLLHGKARLTGNGPAHRKDIRPRHAPPPPHATRL